MKIRKNSGFSMVEVVIALAIILAVSIVAISITLSSITNRIAIVNRTHAQYFADNVWECFKAADDVDALEQFIYNVVGVTYETKKLSEETDEPKKVEYTYTFEEHNFNASITVKYGDIRPTLTVDVRELDDNDEIISFTYTKGAKYDS